MTAWLDVARAATDPKTFDLPAVAAREVVDGLSPAVTVGTENGQE